MWDDIAVESDRITARRACVSEKIVKILQKSLHPIKIMIKWLS